VILMCEQSKLEVNFSHKLKLHISPIQQQQAWEKAQAHSNGLSRHNAYINNIALNAFHDWLSEYLGAKSLPPIEIFPSTDDLPSIWELVNGSAIQIGTQRLVIIPTETDNLTTISVPQEWVDIPNWAGDYYIAIQVDLETDTDVCNLSLCGFTTHQQLRSLSNYNESNRNYILPTEQLTKNIHVMQLLLGLKVHKETPELPMLSTEAANSLLKILSDPSLYSPRLKTDIPFVKWAALISNSEWRKQLYQQRIDHHANSNRALNSNNLNQWFQNIFTSGWQSLHLLIDGNSENMAFNFRHQEITINTDELSTTGVKLIDLGIELGNQTIALLVGLTLLADKRIGISIQLHPGGGTIYLPDNLKLALLSPTDITLQEISTRIQDNFIQLKRFTCERGKSFKVRLMLQEFSQTEVFTIEPLKSVN
jgi:Protein of unknown function (DUF1822)